MSELREFNLPLLRKAVEWAESEARKPIYESEWCQKSYFVTGRNIGRSCETAYCIAGWVAQDHLYESDEEIQSKAMEMLGLDYGDAWGGQGKLGLFLPNNTIEQVREIAERIARRHGQEL